MLICWDFCYVCYVCTNILSTEKAHMFCLITVSFTQDRELAHVVYLIFLRSLYFLRISSTSLTSILLLVVVIVSLVPILSLTLSISFILVRVAN